MSFFASAPIIGKVLETSLGIVDQLVPDKDLAAKIKAGIAQAVEDNAAKLDLAGASIVKTEAAGESWLQRNWRPILMLTIVSIIFNNYVLAPYLSLFTDKVTILDLPGGLWALLNVGVGGYVAGRSGEKIAKIVKGLG